MTTTMRQSPSEAPFAWHPSRDEVEAIVTEMRPLLAALATGEHRVADRGDQASKATVAETASATRAVFGELAQSCWRSRSRRAPRPFCSC